MPVWKGKDNFRELLTAAGYGSGLKGLESLVADLDMVKPPTPKSIKTTCLSKNGRGFKRPGTMKAIAEVLGCKEEDFYEAADPPSQTPLSYWKRVSAGCDVEDRKLWPL